VTEIDRVFKTLTTLKLCCFG